MKIDHKIVCWGDYAIPVPIGAKWMAFDESGRAYTYDCHPNRFEGVWLQRDGSMWSLCRGLRVIPPEPGQAYEQLYWIGD